MAPGRLNNVTEHDVITALQAANGVRDTRSAPQIARASRWSSKNNIARSRSAISSDHGAADDESRRTRKYWEKFAATATRELLREVDLDARLGKPELVFSARVGREPKHPPAPLSDCESDDTGLSLLTCSQVAAVAVPATRRTRRRRAPQPEAPVQQKTNWEEFGKRRGILDQMMRQDADALYAYTKDIGGRVDASDMMTDEERRLLMDCAFQRGLAGADKYFSTENLVTGGNIKEKPPPKPSLRPRKTSDRSTPNLPVHTATGRTPSPQDIAERVKKTQRSQSVPTVHQPHGQTARDRLDEHTSTLPPKSPYSALPATSDPLHDGSSLRTRNLDGRVTKRIHTRLNSTLGALDRMSGYGDTKYDMQTIEEEKGVYTGTDYSRYPRYCQRIRIAPQLVNIISEDIKNTLRRPQRRELTRTDISRFNKNHPQLDAAKRNLVIFNWLNSLDEDEFVYCEPPELDPPPEPTRVPATRVSGVGGSRPHISGLRPSFPARSRVDRISGDDIYLSDSSDGFSGRSLSDC